MACRHPRDKRLTTEDGYICTACDRSVSAERSKRGKNANKAGRRQSWELARDMGGVNHEVEGKSYDVLDDLFSYQSKRGGAFPERIWTALSSIEQVGGRIPVLVIRDAPGRGIKRRGVVIVRYEDWRSLHGAA